jgi:small conductance mechanosensitive channel
MSFTDRLLEWVSAYGPKVVGAIVALVVGFWVIGVIKRAVRKAFQKSSMEETLSRFLQSLIGIALKVVLVVVVLGMVGVEAASFVAILGAATFAVGFALQGSLANLAGGVLIMVFKPYKVGDFIEALGFTGAVKQIQILNTVLNTLDNKTIIIPNGQLATSPITNYSAEPTRRVDMTFGVGYEADIEEARQAIMSVIRTHELILADPAPFVRVSELGGSSVNFACKVWVNAPDYWQVFFDLNEGVKKELDARSISIPYPQMDVHLDK